MARVVFGFLLLWLFLHGSVNGQDVATASSQCTSGFISMDSLLTLNSLEKRNRAQRIIPSLNFSCDGAINKWIVRAQWSNGVNATAFPDLQLWRNSGGNGVYTKVGNTTLNATARSLSSVYELAVNPSLPFQRGDILGIFQPHGSISRLRILYNRTESGNPLNFVFRVDDNVTEPPLENFTTTSEIRRQTVLPLVTVEISRHMSSVPVALVTPTASARLSPTTISVTPSLSTSVTVLQDSIAASARLSPTTTTPSLSTPVIFLQDSSIAASARLSPTTTTPSLSTPVITHSSIADVMPTTLPQPSSTSGNTDESFPVMTVGIATGVGGGSLLAMFIVLIVIAVFLLIWRRKRKYSLPAEHLMDNPLYIQQGQYTHDEDRYTKVAELNANVPTGAQEYELVQGPGASENIEIDFSNPLYAEPEGVEASGIYESTNLDAGNLEWGFYVPTEEQRRKLPSSLDPNENDLYSTVYSDIYTRPAKEQEFFQECNIYWVPSSDPTELYAQLAQYKFREILRHQIKTTEHLGSGQFGNVEKGVWSSPRGPVDVAVKQLNEGMAESDKVKFLKEAAIMGQFRHPHVIKLHGVVTMGEPVMIVLEFMSNGDLRNFLIQNRPSPGELTAPETPNLCLKLSRQVASGMEYLANKSFVHRDLAARNILVSAEMNCKIADFGMARDLEDSEYYVTHGGMVPVKWTAPEAINFKRYSTASDVWSFGTLLFEIWSLGHKPFEGYTNHQVLRLVGDGYRLSPPPGCPRAVYKLMVQCWHPDTESRPTVSELHGALSQPETELLGWSKHDEKVHPQAAVLGAPLEAGKDLYIKLQEMYTSR